MDKWQIRNLFFFQFRVSRPFKPRPFYPGTAVRCIFRMQRHRHRHHPESWQAKDWKQDGEECLQIMLYPSRHLVETGVWRGKIFDYTSGCLSEQLPEDRDVVGKAGWTFLEHELCRKEGGADPRLLQEIILLACDIWLEQSHAGSSWPRSRQATQPLWHGETAFCLQQAAYAC